MTKKPADKLTKTTEEGKIELNEEELSKATGGATATGEHLKEATITHRKAGKGQQEF
jgi:type VI protein secretion system component Hcp